MRNSSLLPLLRSRTQGDLLALTYLHPEREYTLTEAARLIGTSVKSVHTEADRLVQAGLLADRRVGVARLIRAETNTPLARPLTDLLAATYGPLPVLTDALREVRGVDRAYIYGSWAARYSGEAGPPPADVDVLVVGELIPTCSRALPMASSPGSDGRSTSVESGPRPGSRPPPRTHSWHRFVPGRSSNSRSTPNARRTDEVEPGSSRHR